MRAIWRSGEVIAENIIQILIWCLTVEVGPTFTQACPDAFHMALNIPKMHWQPKTSVSSNIIREHTMFPRTPDLRKGLRKTEKENGRKERQEGKGWDKHPSLHPETPPPRNKLRPCSVVPIPELTDNMNQIIMFKKNRYDKWPHFQEMRQQRRCW